MFSDRHSGFLVSDKATVTLIDSDSFQVTAANRNFLCTVGTPEYTPPEIQGKRFDHTSRSPNQDNFGLAVLIFQLLFMGRHPFSGRYLGKGDMPLERAIADFRFAYSSRQTETQMAPPPRVPLLTDFPQYVAEGFEAAFGRATFSRRPTAANWVSLIQKLEGELQQCSATTAHHHVKGKRCPFCYMEQATPGFLAFVSGTQNPLPLHVDIKSLIAQLNSIADPGVPPSLQSVVSSPRDLRPSAAATDVIFSVKRHLWIALATSISAVFLMQFGPPMTILGLFLSCAGLIVSFKPPAGLARIGSARTQAENAWRTVQEAWSRQESNKRFIELKTEAQTVVRLLQELPQEEQRGLQHLERKKRENQLRRHLEKFNIASARIRKIGSGRKVVLASHGIETAADIDEHHLQSVRIRPYVDLGIVDLATNPRRKIRVQSPGAAKSGRHFDAERSASQAQGRGGESPERRSTEPSKYGGLRQRPTEQFIAIRAARIYGHLEK